MHVKYVYYTSSDNTKIGERHFGSCVEEYNRLLVNGHVVAYAFVLKLCVNILCFIYIPYFAVVWALVSVFTLQLFNFL